MSGKRVLFPFKIDSKKIIVWYNRKTVKITGNINVWKKQKLSKNIGLSDVILLYLLNNTNIV